MGADGKNVKILANLSNVSFIMELTDKYVKYAEAGGRVQVKKF